MGLPGEKNGASAQSAYGKHSQASLLPSVVRFIELRNNCNFSRETFTVKVVAAFEGSGIEDSNAPQER